VLSQLIIQFGLQNYLFLLEESGSTQTLAHLENQRSTAARSPRRTNSTKRTTLDIVDMGQVRRRYVKASGPPRTTSSIRLSTRTDRRLDGSGRKVTAIVEDTIVAKLLVTIDT